MKKIYLVSTGDYSEYRIEGVYSTKKKALEAKKRYGSMNDIEEYVIDEMPDCPNGLYLFEVVMDRWGNSCTSNHIDMRNIHYLWTWHDDNNIYFTLWAKDKKHAVKIANEHRAHIIALNLWPKNYQHYAEIHDSGSIPTVRPPNLK